MRALAGDFRFHLIGQCIVGRTHIRPTGAAAVARHHVNAEDRALRLDGHVGAVTVPAFITVEDLDDVVFRIGSRCAV